MHSIEFSHARSSDWSEHFLGMMNVITPSKISGIFLTNPDQLCLFIFTNTTISLFFIFLECVTISSVINILVTCGIRHQAWLSQNQIQWCSCKKTRRRILLKKSRKCILQAEGIRHSFSWETEGIQKFLKKSKSRWYTTMYPTLHPWPNGSIADQVKVSSGNDAVWCSRRLLQ